MKKVLFLAYYFPPAGGGGVQRSSKFVKYLPDFGLEPIVITANEVQSEPKDLSLLNDVRKIKIIRTDKDNIIPKLLLNNKYVYEFFNMVVCPDIQLGWLPYLRKKVDNVIKTENISLVYTSCSPFSLNFEGIRIKKKYGIPWVTDFRDPWTLNANYKPISPIHRWFSWFLEKKSMKICDFYIANTEMNLKRSCEAFPVLKNKSTFIPNGFDPDDFEEKTDTFNLDREESPWQITYIGACYHSYNPEYLFKAIRDFKDIYGDREIIINYAGAHFKCFSGIAEKFGLKAYLVDHGYLSHLETIKLIENSDLLLLYLPKDSKASGWVPGKLYEYIASNKPIFGIVPEGISQEILIKSGRGFALTHDDAINNGFEELNHIWNRWKNGLDNILINQEYIKMYDKRLQTKKLASIFNTIIT